MSIELDEDGQDWRVWQALVEKGGSPKRETEVSGGYWRMPSSRLYATPVITFFDKYGEPIARFPHGAPFLETGEAVDIGPDDGDRWHKFAGDYWPRCQAVGTDEHEAAVENGRWADDLPTRPRDAIGGNNPPEDEVEKLLREARENKAKVEKILALKQPAKTQKTADANAVLIKTMSGQRADLGEAHKKEKEPHLEACRAVDRKFLDLIKEMDTLGKRLKREVIDPFLQEKERVAKEAAAAAQKVIDDAAKAQREAEEAKNPKPPATTDEEWKEAAPPAVTVTTTKVSAGVRGAKTSLRDVRYGVVTDYEKFAAALAKARNSELLTLLDTLGHKMARGPATADTASGTEFYPGLKLDIRRES